MIKASVARSIDDPIVKTSQQALQADGVTPLAVVGETRLALSRADERLTLDALVVEDLDVDVLAGTPFMIANDISVRPAKRELLIQGSEVILYNSQPSVISHAHAVRCTQSYVLRSSAPATVVFAGDFLEMDVPRDLGPDCTLAIEARTDTPSNQCTKVSRLWPQLLILPKLWLTRFVYSTTLTDHEPSVAMNTSTKYISPRPWTPHLPQQWPTHLLLAATVGAQCTSPVSFQRSHR